MQLLPLGGTTRLPPLAALGWIIAYYVEFGKRGRPSPPPAGHLPQGGRQGSLGSSGLVLAPPVGELAAELTERAGYGLPRRPVGPSRNDRTGD